ncbi:MAG: ABC transporter substrate-binding protein [Nocardioides sp.]
MSINGGAKGGTVTVLTSTGLTTTLDPSEVYYVDTASIMSGLVTRSLTQYKYDPKSKQMVLVPDLATNLGTPNSDFTEWKFTIRPGVKWENGDPVTAKDVLFGIQRSMDAKAFPTGPGQYYSNVYFKGGSKYGGPYSDPNGKFQAATLSGNTITIHMDKPFPDMPYWGAFPAMGPIPQGSQSDPATYKKHPLSTGPYMIKKYTAAKELQLVKNPNWDPTTDPARTQYPDGYDFKASQQSDKIDQILLADTGDGQSTLTYDDLLAPDYTKMKSQSPERLVTGGSPCTFYYAPDNRKITDINVRKALSWAFPYKNIVLAGGSIPGVTAIPATNLMPPGMPGRTEYNVTGRQPFQTDPNKSKALLKAANKMGYEIKFLFRQDDPVNVQTKNALVKALTEGGFKPTPVASSTAKYVDDRDNTKEDINVRSAGWCSDWLSGATWMPPIYGGTNPTKTGSFGTNYSALNSPAVDKEISDVQALPLDKQPAAWDALDKKIATKYFPLFTTYYTGIAQAHGSKINGDNDDIGFGMPTWKDIWVSK